MIFVLLYDRQEQRLLDVREAADDVEAERVEAEHRQGVEDDRWEIVSLEASSLDQLRVTHSRYFQGARDLLAGIERRTRDVG